jgi:hypothetical protein
MVEARGRDECVRARAGRHRAVDHGAVAGIEFIADADGTLYTYDVNTNTNYNSAAEARAGLSGMGAIADYLGGEFAALARPPVARIAALAGMQ